MQMLEASSSLQGLLTIGLEVNDPVACRILANAISSTRQLAMCGIAALFGARNQDVSRVANNLRDALKHRGPDDDDIVSIPVGDARQLTLVHTRLSIVGLSAKGRQPMTDEVSGNAIVFNGEIFNYQELAQELERRGEALTTGTDTEVILKGFRVYGLHELLAKLRGMFAFAIWEAATRTLVVVRDPSGIKPLYYFDNGEQFACASEATALVSANIAGDRIDRAALDSYLSFGSVQDPLCIYEEVRSLLPGHWLAVDPEGRVSAPRPYVDWSLESGGLEKPQLAEVIAASVKRHLVADVPVGLFLSGGYDSTALAVLASRQLQTPLRTFTVGFPEEQTLSEAFLAERIATHIGAAHLSIPVKRQDLEDCLPDYFTRMDQPSDDGLNVFLISRAVAAAGMKACLHGVGGDELFGGYPSFRQVPIARRLALLPAWARRAMAPIIDGRSVRRNKLASVLRSDLDLLATFLIRRRVFSHKQRVALTGGDAPLGLHGVPEQWLHYARSRIEGARDDFAAISALELAMYAANKLLRDGDVMSMAFGLELRFPLLDTDLIRTVLAISQEEKLPHAGAVGKPGLVSAVPNFPEQLINQKKRGFTLPLDRWIRSGMKGQFAKLRDELVDCFGFEEKEISNIWTSYQQSPGSQEWLRVWQLMVLGSWKMHRRTVSR